MFPSLFFLELIFFRLGLHSLPIVPAEKKSIEISPLLSHLLLVYIDFLLCVSFRLKQSLIILLLLFKNRPVEAF